MNTVRISEKGEKTQKSQTELKGTITGIKNTLEGMNSILGDTEVQISDLKEKVVKII